jgi:hypothetical protein
MKNLVAHLLPPDDLFYDSEDSHVDLSENREEVIESLKEYVLSARPSILLEHETDGTSYGRVTELFEDEDGLKASFELIDSFPQDRGKLRFVSPRIKWNYKDIYGKVWPAALQELSLVSMPRFSFQKEIGELVNKEDKPEIVMSEQLIIDKKDIGDFTMSPEVREEIMAMMKEMFESMAPVKEEVKEEAEVEMADDMEEDVEQEEAVMSMTVDELMTMAEDERKNVLSQMSSEEKDMLLYDLLGEKVKVEEEAVMSEISKVSSDKGAVEGLKKLYKTDKVSFASVMSELKTKVKEPAKKVFRVSPYTSVMSASKNDDNRAERALKLAEKEGISFLDALDKI